VRIIAVVVQLDSSTALCARMPILADKCNLSMTQPSKCDHVCISDYKHTNDLGLSTVIGCSK